MCAGGAGGEDDDDDDEEEDEDGLGDDGDVVPNHSLRKTSASTLDTVAGTPYTEPQEPLDIRRHSRCLNLPPPSNPSSCPLTLPVVSGRVFRPRVRATLAAAAGLRASQGRQCMGARGLHPRHRSRLLLHPRARVPHAAALPLHAPGDLHTPPLTDNSITKQPYPTSLTLVFILLSCVLQQVGETGDTETNAQLRCTVVWTLSRYIHWVLRQVGTHPPPLSLTPPLLH